MKGSFFAMVFYPSERLSVCVRSLRTTGFKTAEQAAQAITRAKLDGYVKRLGSSVPIWTNLKGE